MLTESKDTLILSERGAKTDASQELEVSSKVKAFTDKKTPQN